MQPISIVNARQNNLKNISLSLPKNKITVFTGVSGSGKSSLVFETIGAEAQRQLNETYDSFARHRLQHYGQPDVDKIEHLNVAIVINQKRIGGNARSTVGTATDTFTLLRLLFSRAGQPFAGYSNAFSFNNPAGMCPNCEGLGKVNTIHINKLIDKNKSLNEGAINFPTFQPGSYRWARYTLSGYFDNDKKLRDYTPEEWELLLNAPEHKPPQPLPGWGKTQLYEGVIPRITRTFLKRESRSFTRNREEMYQVMRLDDCPVCHGARLNQQVLASKIKGKNIADCAAMQVNELISFLEQIKIKNVQTVVAELIKRLQHLADIGLSYLSLDRTTSTLSGGESQRIKMVKHLGSSLTGLIYIFDEPSTGLHPADVQRLNRQVEQLRDKGNTILIVEHDPDIIAIADHVVDMGPKAGIHGGEIVYQGGFNGLKRSKGLTGAYFRQQHILNEHPRQATGHFTISHATLHNVKDVTLHIPKGVLNVVTGVAGSGKSTLINQVLPEQHPDARLIDQSPLRGSRRAHIASYTGVFDYIRGLFAKTGKTSAGLFSANSEGACPECKGLGVIILDLAFMDDVEELCDACNGSGYNPQALRHKWHHKNIAEVLAMTVEEAITFFKGHSVQGTLEKVDRLGLGYLTLGQSLNTFSGGERQRLKLATEMEEEGQLFVFDEPTTGLHPSDTAQLMKIFHEMADKGNTVIIIEHNVEVISQADWVIDIGPGAGNKGGKVVFEGTLKELVRAEHSVTGKYLKAYYSK